MKEVVMENLKSKAWWDAVLVRMIRTAAQSGLAIIGTNTAGITDVDVVGLASAAALAALCAFLTGLAGLPEAE